MGVVSKIARQLTKKVVKKDTPTIQKDVDPLKVARETLPAARDVDIKNLDATTKKFLGKVASIDKPMSTTYKNIFSNETNDAIETVSEILYSDTFGGTTPYGFYKNISQSRLNKVKKNIYNLTQKKLKSYPDELVVYRSGNLDPFKMKEKGVDPSQEPLSFSLNPDYDAELNLPWYERMGSQSLQAYKVKKKDILASTDLRREMREDEIIIRPKDVKAIENKNMNKGGVTMKKQMEMFNEGGLEQDGGSVDPVSGNDVPIGSSKEEVRDDIDAKLSEGEFVFPADVVRFIGLNNLMQIRQEAKAGLKKMEAMGQMGNSEEATMPDDIPFNSEDIMVEDDDGNEGELEMNTGGVVYQPSQVGSQFNIAPQQQQMYQPPQMYQQPMQTGYGPSFAAGQPQPQQYTGYQSLIPMPTQKYENVSYINKITGETMVIPHVGGKPVFEPPEGFTKIKTGEEAPKEEAKVDETLDTSVSTATVTQPKDDPDRMLVGDKFLTKEQREKIEDQENMNKSYDAMVKQMMDNNPGIGMDEIKDKIKAGEGTIKVFGREIKAPGFLFTEDKINEAVDKAYTGSVIDSPPILKRVDGKLVVSDTGEVQIAEDEKPQSVKTVIQTSNKETGDPNFAAIEAAEAKAKAEEAKKQADAKAFALKNLMSEQEAREQEKADRQQEKEDRYNKDTSNFGASDSFKQGGIASKTKKKTMKQGGLASKK